MRLRLDDDHPLTGWHMLAIVLSFFGVIIAVNIAMAIAATGTFPGLVVENSYVASQHYDELLEQARAQEDAGWHDKLEVVDGVLRFSLSRHSEPTTRRLTVSAHVGRPSTTREDRFIAFVANRTAYVADSALPQGLWEVDIEAVQDGARVFRRTHEVFVRPAREDRP